MLYISRRIGENKYAVFDTDDNSETVATRPDLAHYVKLGIKIEGVVVGTVTRGPQTMEFINHIKVYQADDSLTRKQVKAKVIEGVDITLSNGVITNVDWSDARVRDNLFIRLSDYAKSCADSILAPRGALHSKRLGIILDDRIRVMSNTFRQLVHSGVNVDLREVTNEKTAWYVYREFVNSGNGVLSFDFVIDNPARKECYMAYSIVCQNYNPKKLTFSKEACTFVEEKLYPEFKKLTEMKLKYVARESVRARAIDLYDLVKVTEPVWRHDDLAFDDASVYDDLNIFDILRSVTTCPYTICNRFVGYLRLMEPTERVKALYVQTCIHGYRWFFDLCKKLHIGG